MTAREHGGEPVGKLLHARVFCGVHFFPETVALAYLGGIVHACVIPLGAEHRCRKSLGLGCGCGYPVEATGYGLRIEVAAALGGMKAIGREYNLVGVLVLRAFPYQAAFGFEGRGTACHVHRGQRVVLGERFLLLDYVGRLAFLIQAHVRPGGGVE